MNRIARPGLWRGLCLAALLGIPAFTRGDLVTLPAVADTFIHSSLPNNNAGALPWFDAGTDGVGGNRRGLIRFDLAGIPAGSTITAAVLRLTITHVPGFGPAASTFDLHRLHTAWGEGTKSGNNGLPATTGEANWIAALLGAATWTAPGAMSDAAALPSASAAVGTQPASIAWTGPGLIGDVQHWLETPGENHGWLLLSRAEGVSRSVRGFGSREDTVNPAALEIGFSAPPGSNSPPAVSITRPDTGTSFPTTTTIVIEVDASDEGSVTNVAFYADAILLGNSTTLPFSLETSLFPGSYSLTAIATDDQGASTTSEAVMITVTSQVIADPFAVRVPKGEVTADLETIVDGLVSPLGLTVPDDGSGRIVVHDQEGRVWVISGADRQPSPLLDVRDRLVGLGAYDERGLLGFAAHPDFAQYPLVYTFTSEPYNGIADFSNGLGAANDHQSVLAEWRISSTGSNSVDVTTRREILRIDQPQANHNGGALHFGPDGLLYLGVGDGGGAHDTGPGHASGGNAQDLDRIWGKILRIDVDGNDAPNAQYGIPSSNPFAGADGLDEIYAYGFRNPFAFAFDPDSGQLYAADVGQDEIEEIDVVVQGGNYGWNLKEGGFWSDGAGHLVTAPVRPAPANLIDPIAMYDHDDGSSIIGGCVYRGAALPALQGRYLFGDWGSFTTPSGRLFYLDDTNGVKELRLGAEDRAFGMWIKGFGQAANGEVYVLASRALGPSNATGRILRIIPMAAPMQLGGATSAGGAAVNLNWAGGFGPFAVQRKRAVDDPWWLDEAIVTSGNYSANAEPTAGFFRVLDMAGQATIPLSAHLSGQAQRPTPVSTDATGFGLFGLEGDTLIFSIRYGGLGDSAMAAHIHGPATTGTSGPPIVDLQPYHGGAFGTQGTLSGRITVTQPEKAMILSGLTYVNIHTQGTPDGEIRGQIAPVLMQAHLSGTHERPDPIATAGRGLGTLTLVGNQLRFNVSYSRLSDAAIAAHIHGPAPTTTNAGVRVELQPYAVGGFGSNGSLSGTVTLSPEDLSHVIGGQTYINFHTTANPDGEIRGQIVPKPAATPLTASLSGLAERPTPLTNSAAGSGTFMIEADTLHLNLHYTGLSSPATAAHIHGPAAASEPAGVLIDLAPFNGGAFGLSGTLSGSVVLSAALRDAVLGGLTYVNLHTTNHSGGEVRGQIVPLLKTTHLSGVNEWPDANSSPAAGLGILALTGDTLHFVVTYRDLTAAAIGAHIHGPGTALQSVGVQVDLARFNQGGFGVSGVLSGTTLLTPDQIGYWVDGLTYINLHTPDHDAGEIRGHLLR